MRRRVLFVVGQPFVPPRDGTAQVYRAWVEFLRGEGHDVFLLSFRDRRTPWREDELAAVRPLVRDCLVLDRYPSVAASAGRRLLESGGRILGRWPFYCPWADRLFGTDNRRRVQEYVRREGIDTLVVHKVEMAATLGLRAVEAFSGLKIIEAHDVHTFHYGLVKEGLARRPWSDLLWGHWRPYLTTRLYLSAFDRHRALRQELELLSRFDVAVSLSRAESEFLQERAEIGGRARYVPPPFTAGHVAAGAAAGDPLGLDAFDFGFLGSGGYFNAEAWEYLATVLLPTIRRRRPGVRGAVAGAVCDFAARAGGAAPGITLLGRVGDLSDFYDKVRVVVVPLRGGTGVSIKTIEALAFRKAVVSTRAGVRGLDVEPGVDLVVEDDPEAFAAALVDLLENPGRRRQLAEAGARTVQEKHCAARHVAGLRAVFAAANRSAPGPARQEVST